MKSKKLYTSFCNPYRLTILLVFIFISVQTISSQEEDFIIPDSLKSLHYNSILKSFYKTWPDTLTSKIYLNTFLKKAVKEDNTIKIAEAYGLLSYYAIEESEKITLLDRSIKLSRGLDYDITIRGYSFKGGYYVNKGNHTLALDSYLKLLAIAEKVQNTKFIYITKHNIACIKTEIGKHEEALSLFKEYYEYIKTKSSFDTLQYLKSIIPLAESYRYNNSLDSTSAFHSKAIKYSQKSRYHHDRFYGKILINEGINLFFKEKFDGASDSIIKGISLIDKNHPENKKSYVLGEFYLGKLQLLQQDIISARAHFLTMDSIVQQEKITPSEVREGYEFLINFYKVNEKKEEQLESINKLLQFDSIINQKTSFVSSRLFKEFDTPLLLKEKETLIEELKGNNKNLNLLVIFLSSLATIAIVFLYRQYKKRKTYQQKFEHLIHQENIRDRPDISISKTTEDIGIPDEIVADILKKMILFEKNIEFVNIKMSLPFLAKKMNTNVAYLSKIVNHHKGKSFTHYINDLRIEYAVKELKENKTLQKYTIKSIAEEMGFKTAESFSLTFKKNTGIKPSYFIKKLNSLDT